MIEAYPLCWPVGRPRAKYRERGRFRAVFAKARDKIVSEVRLLGGAQTIISTNIELKRDGLPYATFKTPDDSGVAVYFTYKRRQMCFACDRYSGAAENMRAIALTIGALRGVARWGTGDMMEAAFTGFAALPAPGTGTSWRAILEMNGDQTLEAARDNYRRLASKHHPDKGGSDAKMSELNAAYAQAQEVLR